MSSPEKLTTQQFESLFFEIGELIDNDKINNVTTTEFRLRAEHMFSETIDAILEHYRGYMSSAEIDNNGILYLEHPRD